MFLENNWTWSSTPTVYNATVAHATNPVDAFGTFKTQLTTTITSSAKLQKQQLVLQLGPVLIVINTPK